MRKKRPIRSVLPKVKIRAPRLLNRPLFKRGRNANDPEMRNVPIKLIRKDPFGNVVIFKRMLVSMLAAVTYGRFNIINRMNIEGTEHLEELPDRNVLFISNHQTYYADMMAMYHIFCSVKWHFRNSIKNPLYMLIPKANIYYIAAEETMKESGFIPKLLSYTGAVTVKRSWRYKGENLDRGADRSAPEKIKKALDYGWVVTFPQGTTSPHAPIRKGVIQLIKKYEPIVVPVQVDGFRRAFDKKGFRFKKRGVNLHVKFNNPLEYSPDEPTDQLLEKIAKAIGQEEALKRS
ncbi:MAG: lysophospholipid acyltransferase family protein [Flammeovirgaceae bacterium]